VRPAAGTKAPSTTSPLWARPRKLGFQETTRGLGGIAAPLLAGFSLATIATIAAAEDPPRLGDWAVLALAGSAGLLLYSMQVAFVGLGHDPRPSEALSWYPEATVDRRWLDYVRRRQARDYRLAVRYQNRHALTYDAGLLLFLAGLGLIAWPPADDPNAARYAAVGVVAVAFLIELYWVVVRRINDRLADRRERTGEHRRLWPHPGLLQEELPALKPPRDVALTAVLSPARAAGLDGRPSLGTSAAGEPGVGSPDAARLRRAALGLGALAFWLLLTARRRARGSRHEAP
jgi:hypothetical protein